MAMLAREAWVGGDRGVVLAALARHLGVVAVGTDDAATHRARPESCGHN